MQFSASLPELEADILKIRGKNRKKRDLDPI
jgi:hypothetical protein